MQEMDEFVAMLRDSAEGFLADFQTSAEAKTEIGVPRPLNADTWSVIADLGWLGLLLPESLGGLELPLAAAAELAEVMGQYRFPVPYIEAAIMPGQVLAQCGNERLAGQLVSGKAQFALAWQDRAGFDDAFSGCVVADGRISGSKVFVAACEPGSELLVCANDQGVPVIGLVENGTLDTVTQRVATASGSFCQLKFEGVSCEVLLSGQAAESALASALSAGRVLSSAFLTGLSRACLKDTVDYLNQREQFGRKLSGFQSVSHRCVDMHINIELADAVWRSAVESGDEATLFAGKARASDVAQEVCRQAVQLHGAMGFTEECSVGEFLRLALQYGNWLGSAKAMRRSFQSLDGVEVQV